MKIYAKQISPEYQTSPLWLNECFPENIIVSGNSSLRGHTTDAWDTIQGNGDYAAEQIELIAEHCPRANYGTITEMLNDCFPRDSGKSYTTRQVHEWKKLLNDWVNAEEREYATALSLMTGLSYDWRSIRGYCQGEWNIVYYPEKNWTKEALDAFEIEYFNLGTEWMVHDSEKVPETSDEIDGFCIYAYSWNDDGIRKEIADCVGGNASDVVLYDEKRGLD